MATLFFEDSTRTEYSFIAAMLNLGINPVVFNSKKSSINKGESLYDTVKAFEAIGYDGVVIRHSQDEYYNELMGINIPIFNGGDGKSDHPTQTLLDLYTIREHFECFKNLKVCFVGDVLHSRVAHGNAEIMRRLGMKVYISAPSEFSDDTGEHISMDKAVKEMDIINLLRVQFERHNHAISVENYSKDYCLTMDRANNMKENAIIMHPAPVNRGVEIEGSVVESKKSAIYTQMQNGVFVRMAVIHMALEGKL